MIIKTTSGLFVVKPINLTIELFTETLKIVNNSWAYDFVERLYNTLFKKSKNIVNEFKEYYKEEFASFKIFLIKRYNIDEYEAQKVSQFEHTHDILFIKNNETGYDGFINMIISDEYFDILNRVTEY